MTEQVEGEMPDKLATPMMGGARMQQKFLSALILQPPIT